MARGPTGGRPTIQLHPSQFCNLACAHCYSSSGPDRQEGLAPELLRRCLADASALGYRDVAISGGEPLLYPGLADLLAEARALGMHTALTTNGMAVSGERWAGLAPLIDTVAVSVDGVPEEHDAIRGRRGAFERMLRGMPILRASGVPLGLIFTLTQNNVDSLEFVVRLAADVGAGVVQVHPLTLTGRAARDMAMARPDWLERLTAIVEAADLGRRLGVAVHVDVVTAGQLAAYRSRMVPALPVRALAEVATTLVVRADGAVVPLTHEIAEHLHVGNLNDAPLGVLAARWVADGRAEALVRACDRTWTELAAQDAHTPFYWYDEVASRAVLLAA